jgi:hypothetical protein
VNETFGIRILLCGIAVAGVVMTSCGAASAQDGLLDAIFGGLTRSPPPATPVLPPNISGTPGVSITVTPKRPAAGGGAVAYCVRLCDGAHFPLPRLASSRSTPTELCETLCPASRTRIYWGAQIDQAVTANRSRYRDLESALKYRRESVAACTCNGKDQFGTAAVSIYADVTLRPGDIVVTEKGLNVFVGSVGDTHQPADFTPMTSYSGLSADERARLLSRPTAFTPENPNKAMTLNTRIILGNAPLESTLTPPH